MRKITIALAVLIAVAGVSIYLAVHLHRKQTARLQEERKTLEIRLLREASNSSCWRQLSKAEDVILVGMIMADANDGKPIARFQAYWHFLKALGGDEKEHSDRMRHQIAQIQDMGWTWYIDSLMPYSGEGLDTKNYYVYTVNIAGYKKGIQ
jgi:hypothetical protein